MLLAEQGDFAGARAAYECAAQSGHPDAAATAAVNLGHLSPSMAIRRVRAPPTNPHLIPHDHVAPDAAINLAVLLKEQADSVGARAAYDRAIASGHAVVAPRAAYGLGRLLEELGDLTGAVAAYRPRERVRRPRPRNVRGW